MNFQIEKDVFLKILQRVQGVVEKRNTMPILSHILITAKSGGIEVIATDLEISVKDSCGADVTKEGGIAVNARKLFEIIKEAPDEKINISAETGKINIKSGKAKFTINSLPAADFPAFPSYDEASLSKASPETLKEMIEKTVFASSTDETRHNINGVYLEREGANIRMAATDGHRLAVIEKSGEWPALKKGIILPRKGVIELKKFLDSDGELSIGFTSNSTVVKRDGTVIVIRLIDGEFPDYRQVIPKGNEKNVKIAREDFLSSIKRVSLLSAEKGRGIKFGISKGRLELLSNNPDMGEAREEISIQYDNDPLDIGFNATYMMEAVGVIGSDEVVLEIKDRESPAILRSINDDGYLYVVMPMRL